SRALRSQAGWSQQGHGDADVLFRSPRRPIAKHQLGGMIDRRVIRVLTVYSRTFYFTDKGVQRGAFTDKAVQRGATFDVFRLFDEDLNRRLAKETPMYGSQRRIPRG